MSRRECESLRPQLSALLDEELDDVERVRLEGHLASCVACQQLLSEYTALKDRVRYLAPVPPPPPDIWQAVQAEARKDAQRSWFSRWIRVSAAQFTMSSAAVMVLLVLISGFALFQGYQRSINPAIAASFPDAYQQQWPVGHPIRITFNKPMNHDSVVENIQIWPAPEEKQRLPMDWQGETLVIQTDPSRGAPLVADTRYTIMVLPGATDTWGNRLGRAWQLSFEMTHANRPALAEAESSSPDTSPAPAPAQSSSPSREKKTAKGTAGSPSPSPSASPSPSPSALALAGQNPTDKQATVSPTPSGSSDASGSTASPSPISTPPPSESPSPTASPAAPSTASLAAPADSASPTPIPLGSPQTIPVTGAFGSVYWGNQSVQDRLGPPRTVESAIDAAELSFQRGSMYEWLSNKTVYVFYSNGIWMRVQVTTPGASGTGQPVQDSANLWIPPAGFNEAWNATPSIQTDIGYAVSAQARTMEGRMQPFANGTMLYSDRGFVYVIFYDGHWELYPDTSGHGDLITPTPAPDPSPAPATGPSTSPTPDPASESSPPSGDVSGSSPAPSASSSPQPSASAVPDDVILQGT